MKIVTGARITYLGKEYVTIKGASHLLGVTSDHIHRLCREKVLRKTIVDDSLTLINYNDITEYMRNR